MRQDSTFIASKIWHKASYVFLAVGLLLLIILGSRAMARVTDPAMVRGKPKIGTFTGAPGLQAAAEDLTADKLETARAVPSHSASAQASTDKSVTQSQVAEHKPQNVPVSSSQPAEQGRSNRAEIAERKSSEAMRSAKRANL